VVSTGELAMLLTAPIEEIQGRKTTISRVSLEEKITVAVKADYACEAFVGVIVERLRGKSSLEANWSIKGIKFGRTDRDKAGPMVDEVVEWMQRLYNLSDDHPKD
jgi:hypothetical protein